MSFKNLDAKYKIIFGVIGFAIAVLVVILLCQFITLAKVNKMYDDTTAKFDALQKEEAKQNETLDELKNNYEDYVEDYARENGLAKNDEIVFEPK